VCILDCESRPHGEGIAWLLSVMGTGGEEEHQVCDDVHDIEWGL